ncbi:Glucoamylase (glucan-1,4-alpha-glucosidase), GH15 family [Agrococcus baldri]|uniref:Glucoamylase (Glucan-1,4-alpha-glucosidase), GH15 family n=1 Tax=Agrococcus baldri TaxID=153730 RepID=A0AA94HKY5_9MICO|nr:glycoside hydrolase family 15 protein [Agrococcus baldri]SFS02637.1 Glucoamylase (glucan-1,4-alpha-glucosidase), GH15 family [Agrococcus baldri]
MPNDTLAIEDYALIGDRTTAALVGRNGSIDWLCLPHFDSPACFAALLGGPEHGHWRIGPSAEAESTRRYLPGSLVLETTHATATGSVTVTDAMPTGDDRADVVRIIEGIAGEVELEQELVVRFGYGSVPPWFRRLREDGTEILVAIAGPDRLVLRGPELPRADGHRHRSTFTVREGDRIVLDLCWRHSWRPFAGPVGESEIVETTVAESAEWLRELDYEGPYLEAVQTSVLVLRSLTDGVTGGILAAPTTSLPEAPGGERNWDYRFTWLRDASLTVDAMLAVRLSEKVDLWRNWLLRAIAGDPQDMRIMYRRDGGRDLVERELPHLPGYGGAAPVRIGNGAADQRQHDVLGQVMLTLQRLREIGLDDTQDSWRMQRALLNELATHWEEPDQGLWEMRGEPHFFTHSRAMMWAAFDCGVRAIEEDGCEGDPTGWIALRDALREEVLTRGFDESTGSFRQHYGTSEVDASLLQLPTIGIVEATDPRFLGTIARIEQDLLVEGVPLRYRTTGVDGLEGHEFPFVLCGFWLVTAYAQAGRVDDAERLMEQLVSMRNDVGLLAEEIDPATGRHWGNFPQAFSHLGLVLAATEIAKAERQQAGAAQAESAEAEQKEAEREQAHGSLSEPGEPDPAVSPQPQDEATPER